MHHKAFTTDGTLEERVSRVQKYLEELSLHRDSRRGTEGARGPAGADSTVPGPSGKDADPRECVEVAKNAIHAELVSVLKEVRSLQVEFRAAEQASETALSQAVILELLKSGAIDDTGKAVLITGPAGPAIPGPKGDSVVGPSGRDGVDGVDAKIVIGDISVGTKASVSVREENGVQVLDFVLPRAERGEQGLPGRDGADSVVSGPAGPEGREGLQGIPGPGLSREAVAQLVLN